MLWNYPYFDHEVCRLHEQIAAFLLKANNEGNSPRSFSTARHCCPELRQRCESATKLKSKLRAFYKAFVSLNPSDRRKVFKAFQDVNAIDAQLENRRQRYPLNGLPKAIRAPTKNLFLYLYKDALGAGGMVKAHWEKFYESIQRKGCPFCAIEPLHYSGFYKQDYDHLLCKDIYPFAAVNMRNLVPIGRDCNTIFKKSKDILMKNGIRRRAFKPFAPSGVQIKIALTGSRLPTAADKKGRWKVTVTPRRQEVATWIDLFETPRRYEKEVLQSSAVNWIGEFRDVAVLAEPSGGWTIQRLRGFLGRYAKTFNSLDYSERHFLKAPFYDFLHKLGSPDFLKPLLNSL